MNNNISKEEIINQAYEFHAKGNFKEAAKYYQHFINQGFNDYRVFINYGVVSRYLGRLKEAELYTRKAIELNPNFAMAYSNLGSILTDLGKLKEAELYTRKAIQLNPNDTMAYSNLGGILKNLGKLKEAELYTRKAIELNPGFADAYSNLGNVLNDLGKLKEAELYTRKAIQLNPNDTMAYSNLGVIFKDLGRLKEAELYTRKAIELNPNFAMAYSNLGSILTDLGKLREAEVSYRKAIALNPDLSIAFYSLSTFELSNEKTRWHDKLFSKNLLNNQSEKDQVNIFFAKANVLHKESNFKESAKYLNLANNLKQNLNPTNFKYLLKRSKELMLESNKEVIKTNEDAKIPDSIFIVGMPRSGSTLLESILSMNNNIYDLGEKNIFEESFLRWKKTSQKSTLADLYFKYANTCGNKFKTTTNKWLYNYQYTGIIAKNIPDAKIIHCFRNPLDNILSIYRAHFARGTAFASSLVDCAKVYLDQEEVMTEYKNKFRSKIYDLNYDLLVQNPNEEIKSLISWLGWKWDDIYLSPHLNPRSVSTRSNVEVRSPINSKSIGGWKNYKEMLKPAMEIIIQKEKYKDLKY